MNMNKRFLLSIACFGLLCHGAGAQKYTVTGVVPEGVKTVYLQNREKPVKAVDSVAVADGKFLFSGEAQGQLFADVYAGDGNYMALIREGSSVPVVLDGDVVVDFAAGTSAGTPENEGLSMWNARHSIIYKELMENARKARDMRQAGGQLTAQEMEHADSLLMALVDNVKACCEANMTAKFPAYFLRPVTNYMDRGYILPLVDKKPAFLEVSLMNGMQRQVATWRLQEERQGIGVMFTDLVMADTAGVERKLSEYVGKGNYVLLDFWASWCGPCRQEMPFVKAAYEKYHEKGFDIVGLSFDNNEKAWKDAINKLGLPWYHLSDLKGWDCIAGKTYGVNSIPATLLIGPDGKVVAAGLRGDALEKKLSEIFE